MKKYKVLKNTIPLKSGIRAYPGGVVSESDMDEKIFKLHGKSLEEIKSEQPVKSGNSKSDNSKSELFNKGK